MELGAAEFTDYNFLKNATRDREDKKTRHRHSGGYRIKRNDEGELQWRLDGF